MKLKRYIAALLAAVCFACALPSAHGAAIDGDMFTQRVTQLQQIFKDGEYWNRYGANGLESSNPNPCPSCSGRGRYSCNDCSDQCGVFSYGEGRQASQCFGFVCKLTNAVFGGDPQSWTAHTDASKLQVGDIIYGDLAPMFNKSRVLNHAVFVTALTEDTVTFADCNWTGPCRIRWNKTVSRSKVAPSLRLGAVIYHAPNNKVGQIVPMGLSLSKSAYTVSEAVTASCTVTGSATAVLYVKNEQGAYKKQTTPAIKNGQIVLGKLAEGQYRLTLTAADGRLELVQFLVYTAAPMKFKDVRKSNWFYQNGAVGYVYSKGLFQGVSETSFAPNATMQRCMFVTVLGRLAGAEVDHSQPTKFKDVETDQWYSGYVAWADQKGVVNGTGKTAFSPFAPVTREQICKMMVSFARVEGHPLPQGTALLFADKNDISPWAVEYVDRCSASGLINGISENGILYFRPQQSATRAQVATVICNFVSKL